MKTAQPGDETTGEKEDWAMYFTILLSHTSLTKSDIRRSTIPFLKGILRSLPDVILQKQGCPILGMGGGEPPKKDVYRQAETAPTKDAIEAFVKGAR